MNRKEGISVVQCIVLSMCMAPAAHASGWSESPAARSWQRATGTTIDLATQSPVLEGGTLRLVNTQSGSVEGEFVVLITESVRALRFSDSIHATWGATIHASDEYEIASGCVIHDGEPSYFAFLQLRSEARIEGEDGHSVSASSSLSIPVIPFHDGKEAESFIATVRDAANGSSTDSGGIFCHDPTWLGRNGTECCGYLSAYQSNIEGCRRDWWKHMWGCLAVGAGGGWTFFQWCAKTCIPVPPPGNAGCVKGCLIASSVIGLEAAVVCVLAANDAYEGCLARERAAYILNLTNNGCELRDPEGGDQ
jgi:hypothetical protein